MDLMTLFLFKFEDFADECMAWPAPFSPNPVFISSLSKINQPDQKTQNAMENYLISSQYVFTIILLPGR
jgi:hypothetical protein